MKIVHTPNQVLLKKAEKVEKITPEVKKVLLDMTRTLKSSDIGIGLAAPQIGVSLQIFLAAPNLQSKPGKNAPIYTFINPKITSLTEPTRKPDDKTLEGCLSIPDVWGPVKRSESVTLSYMDEDGKHHTKTYKGAMAVVIQHEVDHLEGVLFTHRVVEQDGRLYSYNKHSEKLEEIDM